MTEEPYYGYNPNYFYLREFYVLVIFILNQLREG